MIFSSRCLRREDPPMKGPDVLILQELLQKSGFCSGPLDGVFGANTENDLRSFQQSINLPESGFTSPELWNILQGRNPMLVPDEKFGGNLPHIIVNLHRRKLYFDSDQKKKEYPVAIGKPSTPTPPGNWFITQKVVNPGGPFGARWMRLSIPWGGYGIHGTNNPKSIGKAVSHGCIRMYNKDVIEIYPLTPIGTPVTIIGSSQKDMVIEIGSRGLQVKILQKRLKDLGISPGPIDGYFGRRTRSALIQLQERASLPPSGRLDAASVSALQQALDLLAKDVDP